MLTDCLQWKMCGIAVVTFMCECFVSVYGCVPIIAAVQVMSGVRFGQILIPRPIAISNCQYNVLVNMFLISISCMTECVNQWQT